MSQVVIRIYDVDIHNIGVDVESNWPDSALLYTNAQAVGADILKMINIYAQQINANKQLAHAVTDVTRI